MKVHVDATTALAPELPGDLLFPATPWSVRLAQLCLVAATCVVVLLIVRRRALARSTQAPPTARPPHDVALERLERLRASTTDLAAAHVELATIARDFVTARFGIPARERTTEEVAESLARGVAASPAADSVLARTLRACDGVKFAGRGATADETRCRIDEVAAFVAADPRVVA